MVMEAYSYMMVIALAFIPLGLTQLMMRVARSEGSNLVSLIPITSLPINILFD
jgi:Na+-driven multidrug efflux pump